MNTTPATAFLTSVDGARLVQYVDYWNRLTPTNNHEIFQRWLFAYASVHTTWKSNVALFKAIKGCEWLGNKDKLKQQIIESRAGLHNNRANFITDFADKFWTHPEQFSYSPGMAWVDFRSQIDKSIKGIGRAKIAFAFEMINPTSVQLVCLDTHILQLFGYKTSDIKNNKIKDKDFESIEQHWITTCKQLNIPPALVRFMYWDIKQGKPNSRYWSKILENENKQSEFDELEKQHMDMTQVKNEFVARVSTLIVPPTMNEPNESSEQSKPVKVLDVPESVGKLVEWFITADYSKLKPFKFDNNWEVKGIGDTTGKNGLTLTCGYMGLKNEKGETIPFLIRPAYSPVIMMHSALNAEKGGKAWEIIKNYSDKLIVTNFTSHNLYTLPSKFNITSNDISQFKINNLDWLFVPHNTLIKETPPNVQFTTGIMVQSEYVPSDVSSSRNAQFCYGPFYFNTGINPLLANSRTPSQKGFAEQLIKTIKVYLAAKAADDNKASKIEYSKLAKELKFNKDDIENTYNISQRARSQMALCYHPDSPVKFLGLMKPVLSIEVDDIQYELNATAMAKANNRIYATGDIHVTGNNEWNRFEDLTTEKGVWYEVTKMPGITADIIEGERK